MNILYGVVGEGMGHAMRSRVVLEHLVSRGHSCEIMASGRAVDYLRHRFSDVKKIHGLHIIYEDNRVARGKTVWSNVRVAASGLPKNIAEYFKEIDRRKPDVVITDFESWTYLYAKAHRLPVLSIDNMQIINRCELPSEVIGSHRADFEIARTFVKAKVPWCNHYLVTTFFRPRIRKSDTSLYPPILRPEILSAKTRDGGHLVVYQTAEGHEALVRALKETGLECRVYGVRRDLEREVTDGTIRYRPFDEASFISDLATCRGVVASGGFTLMGEAVYLRKPMLSVPLNHQFEQILNAKYLDYSGYGCYADAVSPRSLREFLERAPDCAKHLSAYEHDGNRSLLAAVDEHLDRAAAGVY